MRAHASARGIAGLLLALGPVTAYAQATSGQPRFEVASVAPHVDTGDLQAGIEVTEGFVRIRNLSLRVVIGMAYGVRDARAATGSSRPRGLARS